MPKEMPISPQDLREFLSYDPLTGRLTWTKKVNRNIRVGDEAGSMKGTRSNKYGKETRYRYVRLNNVETPASRVAWCLHYGVWPERSVLLKDGDPANLRIDNLEEARFTTVKYAEDGRKKHFVTKEAQHGYALRRYYGLSLQEYGEKLLEQNGVCAICAQPEKAVHNGHVRPLSVDHCHTSNNIRGLLCSDCNTGIGLFRDDRDTLLAAVRYLDKHSGKEADKPSLTIVGRA